MNLVMYVLFLSNCLENTIKGFLGQLKMSVTEIKECICGSCNNCDGCDVCGIHDYYYDDYNNSAKSNDCKSCNKCDVYKLYDEYDEYIKCNITNRNLNCEGFDKSKRYDSCDGSDDLSNRELHVDTAKDEVWPGLAIEGGLTLIVTLK
jgi:hypothetical protein